MKDAQESFFPEPEPKQREYPRDEIWDKLEEEFGPVLTKTERGRRNRAVRELREAGLTPDQIGIGVDYCRRNFTQFTEIAVCGWISRALHEHKRDPFGAENVIELAMRRGI